MKKIDQIQLEFFPCMLPTGNNLVTYAMTSMTRIYNSLMNQLYKYNAINPVSLGLNNMEKLNNLFGNPLANIPVIHVVCYDSD